MALSREDVREIVRDLADGYSNQSKDSNRLWLALIAAAAVVLFPNSQSQGVVSLPFGFGMVPRSIFDPIGFGILFVLVMGYCQAYAHALKAANFAQKLLDDFETADGDAKAREFYDILALSSFARVWPLVDLLQISHRRKRVLVQSYYVILKSLTLALLLGIPLFALVWACRRIVETSSIWVGCGAFVALIIVGAAVLQIVVAEFRYARRVVARVAKSENQHG